MRSANAGLELDERLPAPVASGLSIDFFISRAEERMAEKSMTEK